MRHKAADATGDRLTLERQERRRGIFLGSVGQQGLPVLDDLQRRGGCGGNGKQEPAPVAVDAPLVEGAGQCEQSCRGARGGAPIHINVHGHHRAVNLQIEQLFRVAAPAWGDAGLSPALARLYGQVGLGFLNPIHSTLMVTNAILIGLIAGDWRRGERRLAYPLLLAWNVAIQLVIMPLSATSGWLAFCRWFAA